MCLGSMKRRGLGVYEKGLFSLRETLGFITRKGAAGRAKKSLKNIEIFC